MRSGRDAFQVQNGTIMAVRNIRFNESASVMLDTRVDDGARGSGQLEPEREREIERGGACPVSGL